MTTKNKKGILFLIVLHILVVVLAILFLNAIIPTDLLNPFAPIGFFLIIFPFALLVYDIKFAAYHFKKDQVTTGNANIREKLLSWLVIIIASILLLYFVVYDQFFDLSGD